MSRPRSETTRQAAADEIKQIARRQMSEMGTGGLSLRGIAREMGITAPAIYNYYPRLDDLITALIIDAFKSHGDAMDAAAHAAEPAGDVAAVHAALLMYRDWGVANPVDFQLIYGNPIPGYAAPGEITIPLARRPFDILSRYFIRLWQSGMMRVPPEYEAPPASVLGYLLGWRDDVDATMPEHLMYILMAGWTRIHGVAVLEIVGQLAPALGDVDAFYRYEVDAILIEFGLTPP